MQHTDLDLTQSKLQLVCMWALFYLFTYLENSHSVAEKISER